MSDNTLDENIFEIEKDDFFGEDFQDLTNKIL